MKLKNFYFSTVLAIALPFVGKSQNGYNMDTVRKPRSEPGFCMMGLSKETIKSLDEWSFSKNGISDYQKYRQAKNLSEAEKENIQIIDRLGKGRQEKGWTLKTVTVWGSKKIGKYKYILDYLSKSHNKTGDVAWLTETYNADSSGAPTSVSEQECRFLQTDHEKKQRRFAHVSMEYNSASSRCYIITDLEDDEDYDAPQEDRSIWNTGEIQLFRSEKKARVLFDRLVASVTSQRDLRELHIKLEDEDLRALKKKGEHYAVAMQKIKLSPSERKEERVEQRKARKNKNVFIRNYVPGQRLPKKDKKEWRSLDEGKKHFIDSIIKPFYDLGCTVSAVSTRKNKDESVGFWYDLVQAPGKEAEFYELYRFDKVTKKLYSEYSTIKLKKTFGDSSKNVTEKVHLTNTNFSVSSPKNMSTDVSYEKIDWTRGEGSVRDTMSYYLLPEKKDSSFKAIDQREILLRVAGLLTQKQKTLDELIREFRDGKISIPPYMPQPFMKKSYH